ncbi:MAG: glycosyltransferase family 2 protein [Candidatus Firestonebacteria bacterium]
MSTIKDINIIIAVYNQLDYTMQCFNYLRNYTDLPYQLIIIDNGSTDGTADYLKKVDARVITNKENLGCAYAWNQGIKVSQSGYKVIMNNDILVTPYWLGRLVKFMEKSRYGIVGPAIREGVLDYNLIEYADSFSKRCKKAKRHEVFAACMLIKSEVFERVGFFDEQFIIGTFEDMDFLWRCQEKGIKTATTGSVLVHHFSQITQKFLRPKGDFEYHLENEKKFINKWGRSPEGNWWQRRLNVLKRNVQKIYEKLIYGYNLIERIK